jgi:penicillin-binding protein 1A
MQQGTRTSEALQNHTAGSVVRSRHRQRGLDRRGGEGGKTGTTNDNRDLLFVGFEPCPALGGRDLAGQRRQQHPPSASSALAASLWGEIIRTGGT